MYLHWLTCGMGTRSSFCRRERRRQRIAGGSVGSRARTSSSGGGLPEAVSPTTGSFFATRIDFYSSTWTSRRARRGATTLRDWVEATGLDTRPYVLQRTPSGGAHLLGRIPEDYEAERLPNSGIDGIDVLRQGRQFVRAPSATEVGCYQAVRPLVPISQLPEWPRPFLDHLVSLRAESKSRRESTDGEEAIPQGSRNNTLTSLAGTMRRRGMSELEISAALAVVNHDRCSPPLPEEEVSAIARSVARYRSGSINDPRLHELNETYAVVQVGSDVRIMQERGKDLPVFMTPASFRMLFRNQFYEGGNKPKTLANAWLEWSGRRGPYRMVFKPGAEEVAADEYNLWRGWGLDPSEEGSCDLFLQHLLENVVGGNRDDYEWLLDWLADLFQNPQDRSLGVAVAFRGEQGVGKSFVGDQLRPLLGHHHTVIDKPELLTGRFNKHLASALLVQADEAFWAGDKRKVGPLKHLVTGRTMQLEMKGIDAQEVPNFVRLLITTNEVLAWPTELSDRRLVIFDVKDTRRGDRSYFRAIEQQLKNGGYEKLLHTLLNRAIDRDRLESPPTNDALVEQAVLSLTLEQAWLHGLLESGVIPGPRHGRRPRSDPCGSSLRRVPQLAARPCLSEESASVRILPQGVFAERQVSQRAGCPGEDRLARR